MLESENLRLKGTIGLTLLLKQLLIEVPYNFMQTLLLVGTLYPMISFQWTAIKFSWYFFFVFTSFLYFTYFGMMLVAVSPNVAVGSVIVGASVSFWNLFSGFLILGPVSLFFKSQHRRKRGFLFKCLVYIQHATCFWLKS